MNLISFILISIFVFQYEFENCVGKSFVPAGVTDHTNISCSDFLPKKNFNMQKFLGTWLIVETYTESGDPIANCLGVKIAQAPINKTFIIDIFLRTAKDQISMLQRYIKNPNSEEGYLDGLTGSLEADQDYVILETDYDSSALILTCMDVNFDGVTDLIEIDFLSRGTELEGSVFEKYVDILESYGIWPEFVTPEQEYCP